ncbi:hypothetical protein HWV62_1619 [Athelia sp. TMB]|nr:hypothetical protein HWV62_1619 [Athelia sp. TMB]
MTDVSSGVCQFAGGPPLNTDISGVGVRVSFYLQTIFLALQAARSATQDEIAGAEYTLIATNMAMAITALILGLKPIPEISFHDALVVLYLLFICWTTNYCVLASCNGTEGNSNAHQWLQHFSVLQSIVLFAFGLAILISAKTFGSNPECNRHAVLVLFWHFSVFPVGRIVGGVAGAALILGYTYITVKDYLCKAREMLRKRTKPEPSLPVIDQTEKPNATNNESVEVQSGPDIVAQERLKPNKLYRIVRTTYYPTLYIIMTTHVLFVQDEKFEYQPDALDGKFLSQLVFILILWALSVMNTELLIIRNKFAPADSTASIWQFGQILPLLLVAFPMVGMCTVFREYGLGKSVKKQKVYKAATKKDDRTGDISGRDHASNTVSGKGHRYPSTRERVNGIEYDYMPATRWARWLWNYAYGARVASASITSTVDNELLIVHLIGEMSEPTLGSIVEIPVGRGVVRFAGATSFAAGKWVGIELYTQEGKNNGTINGVAYFTCKPNYGVFVRPSQVKVIGNERDAQPVAPPKPPAPAPPTPASAIRPGHARTPSLARANSLRSTAPTSRAGSPAKPSPSASRASPGPGAVASPRVPRIASPSKRQPSLQLPLPASARKPSFPPRTESDTQTQTPTRDGFALRRPSIPRSPASSSGPSPASPPSPSPDPRPPSALSSVVPESPQPPPAPIPAPVLVDDTELVEARAKIRVLETHRADDARHVRELETQLAAAAAFVALRPKLQAKLQSQATEISQAKRELADARAEIEKAEARVLDAHEQLEMAMLDKEVAEERAEIAEGELEGVREQLAIAEVELEVRKEEAAAEDDASPPEVGAEERAKSSLAYVQLEKQNERLKEALLRLRDMSAENDAEARRRIGELERDLVGVEEMRAGYDTAAARLVNAETQISDLKVQLDDALGAEEMLVQLTERNLELGEKIEEMRITIEDLEALQELNDELEENHVEAEKALQEDLAARDAQLREGARRIDLLEDACTDFEGTIAQFRDLVANLQKLGADCDGG